jgi:hypothetical protein
LKSFSLRASLFAFYISNSETKGAFAALWNTGNQLNVLLSMVYWVVLRDFSDFGVLWP